MSKVNRYYAAPDGSYAYLKLAEDGDCVMYKDYKNLEDALLEIMENSPDKSGAYRIAEKALKGGI